MEKLIIKILVGALALLLVAELLPGVVVDGLYAAFIAAVVLGLLNAIVRPILVILTLPITVVTLGLFIFVINALLFQFAASFIDGFSVVDFWTALLASLCVSIITTLASRFIK